MSRNGIRKFDWDPTKWILYTLNKFTTLVPNLRQTSDAEISWARQFALSCAQQPHSTPPHKTIPLISADHVSTTFPNVTWILIDGFVVDVTTFIDEHPGGAALLQEAAAPDQQHTRIDVGFAFREAQHSQRAHALLESRRIARII